MKKNINIGERHGRLTIIKELSPIIYKPRTYERRVLCICDCGKEVSYQWLTTWESESGKTSCGIEDYCCLSASNPKCKVLAAKYEIFDKKKDKIINSILEIMSPWESKIQSEIIDILKLKLHI